MSNNEDPPAPPPSDPEKSKPDFGSMARRLAGMGMNLKPVVNGLEEARKRSEEQRLELAKRLAAPPRSLTEGMKTPAPLMASAINLKDLEHPSLETNRQIRALRTEMEAARDHLGSVAEHQQKQVELVDALLDAFVAAAATAQAGAEESKEIAVQSREAAAAGVKIAKLALAAAIALGLAQIIVAGLPYVLKSEEPAPAVITQPAPQLPRAAPPPSSEAAKRPSPHAEAIPAPKAKAAPAAPEKAQNGNR
jgi:hypothetical protein